MIDFYQGAAASTCTDTTKTPSTEKPVTKMGSEVKYCTGYGDCTKDVLHFLVNVESMDLQRPCFQRLRVHLQHQLQLLMMDSASSIGSSQTLPHVAKHKKRKHASAPSYCSSSSSSNDETSRTSKRPRSEKDKQRGRGTSMTSGSINSSGSDKESSNSDSAICMDDFKGEDMADNPTNANSPPNDNKTNGSGPPGLGLLAGLLGSLPQAVPIPLRSPYMPSPFSTPTYALHPSGTHYIPVALHPNIPVPPYTAGHCGILPNTNPLGMGLPFPPQPYGVPFGMQGSMGIPYTGFVPEYGINRQSSSVKSDSTTSEEESSSGSRSSGNCSENLVHTDISSSPNSLSDNN